MLQCTMHADVRNLVASAEPGAMRGLEIHFDLNIGSSRELMRVTDDAPRPYLLANTRRVTGYIRSDGRMYDTRGVSAVPYDLEDPGELGVRLLANDPDLNLDGDVSYTVSGGMDIDGDVWSFYPFNTPAMPSVDTTVDLASFAPGPGHTLVGVPELGLVDDLADMTAVGKLMARAASQSAGRSAIDAASGALGYPVEGAARNGTDDDRAALAAADTAAVAANRQLVLLPGVHRIASNLTISSHVKFMPGAILKPDSGVTVTLPGTVDAPLQQIFDHSAGGKVVPKKVPYWYPAWWGPVGTADDSAAWQACIAAAAASQDTLSGFLFGPRILAPAGINRVFGLTFDHCVVDAGRGSVAFAPPVGSTEGTMITVGDYAELAGGWYGSAADGTGAGLTLVHLKGARASLMGHSYVYPRHANVTGVVAGDPDLPSTTPVVDILHVNSGQTTPPSGTVALDIKSPDFKAVELWLAQTEIGMKGTRAGAAQCPNIHIWGCNTGISGNNWDKSTLAGWIESQRGWGIDVDRVDVARWDFYLWANGLDGGAGGARFLQSAGSARRCRLNFVLDDNVGTGVLIDGPDNYEINTILSSATVRGGGSVVTTTGVSITSASFGTYLHQRGADATTPLTDSGNGSFIITDPQTTDGLTMGGPLVTKATASGGAGFRLPHGTAPSAPVDGDVWTRTDGLFARINGTTRSVVRRLIQSVTGTVTLSAAGSDYLVLLGTGADATLPTANGNTGIYTLVNLTTSPVSVASTSSQTFNGAAGPLIVPANTAVIVASDGGSNWIYVSSAPTLTTAQLNAMISDADFVPWQGSLSGGGSAQGISLALNVNQSGTADFTALKIDVTETAVGSGNKRLLDLLVGGSSKFSVSDAGVVFVGTVSNSANAVVSTTGTQTQTNKRITPRVTTASTATPTINTDSADHVNILTIGAAITSMTTNLSGTPTDGQRLRIRFKDTGTGRAITWGASFTGTLLATTVANMTHTQELVWDSAISKWAGIFADTAGY